MGEAFIAGLNLSTNVHSCRRKIGFCPQFDALFELLTGREHLMLYARIKGIAEKDIARVVEGKLKDMALVEYADRAAGTYSGGNKRKLSVAIAMIGEPSIVFLDEPSTGMDPVARRFMWEVITDIVTKREKCSVILTTHLMEECEALCTRIGIMVGGKLKCLGSSQRLRTRYGRGYQIEITYKIPDDEELGQLTTKIVQSGGGGADRQGSQENVLPTVSNILSDIEMNPQEVSNAFSAMNKGDWSARLTPGGSGGEIGNMLIGTGKVSAKLLANWYTPKYYDLKS
jgi:ABC-type multidrug transport system ATPase subunit